MLRIRPWPNSDHLPDPELVLSPGCMLIAQPTLTSHTTVCYVLHHNKLILELLFQKKKES